MVAHVFNLIPLYDKSMKLRAIFTMICCLAHLYRYVSFRRSPYRRFLRYTFAGISLQRDGSSETSSFSRIPSQQALEWLDCMTTPVTESEPEYNRTKCDIRDKILFENSYNVTWGAIETLRHFCLNKFL
jgi:hypothetical protein